MRVSSSGILGQITLVRGLYWFRQSLQCIYFMYCAYLIGIMVYQGGIYIMSH